MALKNLNCNHFTALGLKGLSVRVLENLVWPKYEPGCFEAPCVENVVDIMGSFKQQIQKGTAV